MKRWRIIAAIMVLSLFVTAVPASAVKKQEEQTVTTSAEWVGMDKGLGHIPAKKEIYNKKDLVDDSSSSGSKNRRGVEETLPSSYDARTEGVVSSVKDQGGTSNCWAFAAIGSGESGLMKKGVIEPDLSERHLAYTSFHYWTDPLNLTEGDEGQLVAGLNSYEMRGNSQLACNTLAAWRGAVDEEKAPFDVIKDMDVDERDEGIRIPDSMTYQQDSYHLENAEFVYLATPNRIKKLLMERGCAVISFHAPETWEEEIMYANEGYTAYYSNDEDLSINHDVLLVGWDDDYPVKNFNPGCRPKKPGAWLIRNSWGTDEHEGGYLWISYEDAVLSQESNEVVFFDMAPADNYDNNYQYDGGTDTTYWWSGGDIDYIANIFTAQYKETLEAVSVQTGERNVNYDIDIYKVESDSDPESGEKLTNLTGTLEERGYHTIDFTEQGKSDIALEKGEKISVVVSLTNEDGECSFIAEEAAYDWNGFTGKVSLKEGESFFKGDSQWSDSADYPEMFQGNWRIKAFTSVDDSVPCDGIAADQEEISVWINEKTTIAYTLSPENVTNEIVTWESADESIARVSNGVVYGIRGGKTTITGRINGHEMTVSVTVKAIPAESISLPQSMTIYRNQSQKLEAVITPADTTDRLTWSSSDSSKVLVYDDGTIVGLQETGKDGVVIEATAGDQTAECVVTVVAKNPQEVTLEEMQSFHPYFSGITQIFEYARENAISYQVTFSEDTEFEEGLDFLWLCDDRNRRVQSYTGQELAGKTITIPYRRIRLELESDEGIDLYGFRITSIVPEFGTVTPTTQMPTTVPSVTPIPDTANKTYQVTMVTGIGEPRVYTVKAGEKAYPLEGGPGRAGYEFLGWYNGNVKYNFETPVQGNLTLTAKWKKITVKKTSVKKAKKKGKKITVTVKKVTGAAGYQVKAGSNKKVTKYKKTVSGKKTKLVIKKWKKKKCYVKVRAYKLDSTNRKVYGAWSKVKKVK